MNKWTKQCLKKKRHIGKNVKVYLHRTWLLLILRQDCGRVHGISPGGNGAASKGARGPTPGRSGAQVGQSAARRTPASAACSPADRRPVRGRSPQVQIAKRQHQHCTRLTKTDVEYIKHYLNWSDISWSRYKYEMNTLGGEHGDDTDMELTV